MRISLILNDPRNCTERTCNGLRLTLAFAKAEPSAGVTVFLMAGAVVAAKRGQTIPDGHYNAERVLKRFGSDNNRNLLRETCMDGRVLSDAHLIHAADCSSTDELARATLAADKVLVF